METKELQLVEKLAELNKTALDERDAKIEEKIEETQKATTEEIAELSKKFDIQAKKFAAQASTLVGEDKLKFQSAAHVAKMLQGTFLKDHAAIEEANKMAEHMYAERSIDVSKYAHSTDNLSCLVNPYFHDELIRKATLCGSIAELTRSMPIPFGHTFNWKSILPLIEWKSFGKCKAPACNQVNCGSGSVELGNSGAMVVWCKDLVESMGANGAAFQNILLDELARVYTKFVNNVIVNGDGTEGDLYTTGLVNVDGTQMYGGQDANNLPAGGANNTVVTSSTSVKGFIKYQEILDLLFCGDCCEDDNRIFLMNCKFYKCIMAMFADTNETFMYQQMLNGVATNSPQLLGRRVVFTDALAAPSADGSPQPDTVFAILFDPQDIWRITRGGMDIRRSEEATIECGGETHHLFAEQKVALRLAKCESFFIARPDKVCLLKTAA